MKAATVFCADAWFEREFGFEFTGLEFYYYVASQIQIVEE